MLAHGFSLLALNLCHDAKIIFISIKDLLKSLVDSLFFAHVYKYTCKVFVKYLNVSIF